MPTEIDYFDPMSIDFASLDAVEDKVDTTDTETLDPFSNQQEVPDEDSEATEENLSEDDIDDVEGDTDNDEQPRSLDELLERADDDSEFTFATTRGEQRITKRQMAELAEKSQEIEEAHTFTLGAANDLKQAYASFVQLNAESVSETRRRAAALQNILQDRSLAVEQRGQYSLQLEDEQNRLRILEQDGQQAKQMFLASFEEDKAARIENTNRAMLPKYGNNWQNGATNLYQWVISQGVPGEDIGKALSPALAEIFIKARQFDLLEASKKSKLKAVVAPKSKPSKPSQRGVDNVKQKALSKVKRPGGVKDMADLFQYLE